MSSATGLWKLFRDQAERNSGIGPKLFGFIAESVFILDRIPHVGAVSGLLPSSVAKEATPCRNPAPV
jgi:hypothetical protein